MKMVRRMKRAPLTVTPCETEPGSLPSRLRPKTKTIHEAGEILLPLNNSRSVLNLVLYFLQDDSQPCLDRTCFIALLNIADPKAAVQLYATVQISLT